MTNRYSQINGLVPVDDVATEGKGLDVDHMHVTPLRTYVQPLALEGQAHVRDPVDMTGEIMYVHQSLSPM